APPMTTLDKNCVFSWIIFPSVRGGGGGGDAGEDDAGGAVAVGDSAGFPLATTGGGAAIASGSSGGAAGLSLATGFFARFIRDSIVAGDRCVKVSLRLSSG